MFRIVRLDHQQVGAGFEEEYLSGRLLARLMDGATDLPDTDLIVYSCDTPNLPPLAADAIAAADRPVLMHLSNETLQHNSDYYSRARWVFRSCFDPGCTQPNVTTAPLGYRSGFAAGAKTQAEEALRLQPEGRVNAEARLVNGRALFAQNRYDDAARAFMAIALLYDEKDLTPEALVLAEESYRRAQNIPDAERAREELQRRYPDYKPRAQS
jgi:tetratricopeptide (TPR) repeat protein